MGGGGRVFVKFPGEICEMHILPHLLNVIPWFRKKETQAFWMGKYIPSYLFIIGWGSWILLFLPLLYP